MSARRSSTYYGVPWEYEPRTFVLEADEDGRVVEAITPDFYLPEQDLYVELTVMKQSLVTRKNRKLRKLRERYPDVKVKLFYRRDFERLAQKYGLEPPALVDVADPRIGDVYLTRGEIAARVDELGAADLRDYDDRDLVLVSVLARRVHLRRRPRRARSLSLTRSSSSPSPATAERSAAARRCA